MNFTINRVTQIFGFEVVKNIIYRWFTGWDSMLPMQAKVNPGWETKILLMLYGTVKIVFN